MPDRRSQDIGRTAPRRRLAEGEGQKRRLDADAPSRRSRPFRSDDEWSSPFREDIFESSTLEPHANRQRPVDEDDMPLRTRRAYRTSTVAEIRREDGKRRASRERPKKKKRIGLRIFLVVFFVIALVAAGVSVYFSPLFEIKNIDVEGADHLTAGDMAALVDVPQGATLLNVDTGTIEATVLLDSWVEEVKVSRVFPNTLKVDVTERQLAAVVEIANADGSAVVRWAIAKDGVWLMPIPDADTEYGQTLNPLIYEDVENVLTISGAPFGLVPEIGTKCTDMNVNNALEIINGLTTELADRIKSVNATDPDSTMLILRDGVEISFGKAEDIREKERICMEILEANPGAVVYINVRVADRPTWRSV